MNIFKSRSALVIVVSYFTISFLYVILSERFLLYLFQNHSSNALIHEIQYYNALAFVLLTAVILVFILRKRDVINNHSISEIALSELLLKEASEMAKIGVYEFSSKKDSKYFSDGIYRVFNIPPGQESPFEAMRKSLEKQSNALLIKLVKECMEKGTPFDVELEIEFVEKSTNWIRVIGKPIYDENNDIIGRRGVIQDVTDIKRSQLELELSRNKLQSSLELVEKKDYSLKEASKMAKIGYWEYNSVTDIAIWSEYVYHVLGFDPKEGPPPQKDITKIFDKESQKKHVQANLDLATKDVSYDIELKSINLKNEEVWIRDVVQPIYNEQNEIVGKRGVLQNITDSKKAQLELERSRNKLQDSLDLVEKNEHLLKEASRMANLGYWGYNNQTDTISWSEAIHQIYGTDSKKGIPELDVILSCYNKKSKKQLVEATLDLANNGVSYDIELQMTNLKNEKRWFRNIGEAIYNDKNEIVGRRGVSQDITHQKLIENNLKRSKSKIKKVLAKVERSEFLLNESGKIAKIGAWEFDLASQKISWTNQVFKLFAIPVGEVPSLDEMMKYYIEGSDEILKNAIEECVTDKKKYDIELRLENADNEKIWVNAVGSPVLNEKGQLTGLRGIIQDITEQKRIRDEVDKAEKMYRLLADNANDMICLHEPDSTLKYISPSIKTILGYETSDFLGKKAISLVHKEDVLSLKKALKEKIFKGLVMDAFPFRARHKKGHFVWLEILVSPVYIDKKISSFISSTRDITQWILAKKEIQKYQTSLQKLTTEITLIEEKQKKEIATNIHDHLSQSLIISKMKINELKKKPQLKIIDKDLQFIETHISEALENSRKITYELSPPVLYQLGIVAALNWLLDTVETTHKIECQFNSNVTNIKLDEVKSILLFRSIQEVITNAIKYANASLITLNIDKNKLGVYILITDNGDGFDTSLLNNHSDSDSDSGFGLFTVQERIRNIQGKFTIESEINEGTVVKIILT
jgi:PAS domain S-box-containing protein